VFTHISSIQFGAAGCSEFIGGVMHTSVLRFDCFSRFGLFTTQLGQKFDGRP
jgi:hypothetical protein